MNSIFDNGSIEIIEIDIKLNLIFLSDFSNTLYIVDYEYNKVYGSFIFEEN